MGRVRDSRFGGSPVVQPVGGRRDVSSTDEIHARDQHLIDAFIAHLELERRLSPHTVSAYRRDVEALAVFQARAGSSIREATRHSLRRFIAQQTTRGYARSSVARRVAAVRTFYRWAKARRKIPADPASALGRPKVTSRLPTVLRPDDAATLTEAPWHAEMSSDEERSEAGIEVALRDRA